jgi:hypothetical protein
MPFVPRPILRSAGVHVVRSPRETPGAIAMLYGQPASSGRDLVAANPHRPYTLAGLPKGSPATFRHLAAGDELRLPWFWFEGRNAGKRSLLPPGTVGDVMQDEIAAAIGDLLSQMMPNPTPAEAAVFPAAINTLALWWRQDHPGGGVPTKADLNEYAKSSTSWWLKVGEKLPPEVAAAIPWNEVPFRALALYIKQSGVHLSILDWAAINQYLEANVTPGMFPFEATPVDWKGPVNFASNVPGTQTPWPALPWKVMPVARWDLLPIGELLQTPGKAQGATAAEQTAWFLGQIKAIVEKKNPPQGGPSEDITPNVTYPGPIPPDCSSYPAGSYPEKNAQGLFTGQCVTCGKNATVNLTDGWCDCKPGFILDPTNPYDCIPDPQNAAQGCPNGGTLVNVQDLGPRCMCPDGKLTPTGPTGGCKAAAPPPPKEESSSSNTALIVAGGVAIGLAALFFANKRK